MGDLEPLAEPAEVGGVLADDVAAAHRQDADLLGRARADLALAAVARDLAEIAPSASASTDAIASAVPDGASFFCRWCSSTISTS